MKTPIDISSRQITEARITLGERSRAQSTATTLLFAYDHARARDAVLSEFDEARITRTGFVAQMV